MTLVLSIFLSGCSDGDIETAGTGGTQRSEPFSGPPPVLVSHDGNLDGIATTTGVVELDQPWPGPIGSPSSGPSSTAVIAGDSLVVASADGTVDGVDCVDCVGVVWSANGDGWLVTRDRRQPDLSVGLMRFTLDLDLIDESVVERIVEEQDPDLAYGEHTYGPPRPVLSTAETVYLSYLSVNGGARGGPDVLARHDITTGRLIDFTYVDGLFDFAAVSPDGQTLAVVATGSGGACVTIDDVQLFETESLRRVPVGDLIPPAERAAYAERAEQPVGEFEYVAEPWLTIHDGQWLDNAFVAIADAHNPLTEGCDDDPAAWTIVVGEDGAPVSSTSMAEVQATWNNHIDLKVGIVTSIDGTCANLALAEGWGDRAALLLEGELIDLAPYALVGGGSPLPATCWPREVR